MSRAKKIDSVILREGVVAGFLVSSIKNYPVNLDYNDQTRGEIVQLPHTKIVVSLVLDAGTIKQVDYLKGPDPSKPLTFELHTLLRVPAPINGVPQKSVPLDKDPSDDFVVRARFIKYADLQRILKMSGYKKGVVNKYPLTGGHIYMPMTLGGKEKTTNYPAMKDFHIQFGGKEMIEEIAKDQAQLTGILDDALDADVEAPVTEVSNPVDDAMPDDDTGPSAEEIALLNEERNKVEQEKIKSTSGEASEKKKKH